MKKLNYKGYECVLRFSKYQHGNRTAIELYDANDGDRVAVATTNLPDEPLGEDEVFIKDYSENEGMVDFLVKEGIIERTSEAVKSGYVSIPKCKLLVRQ